MNKERTKKKMLKQQWSNNGKNRKMTAKKHR